MVAQPVFSIASCRVHSLGNKLKTLGFIVCLNSLIERVLVSSAVYMSRLGLFSGVCLFKTSQWNKIVIA